MKLLSKIFKEKNNNQINLKFTPVKIKKGDYKNCTGKYIKKAWYKKEKYVLICIYPKNECEKYVLLKENSFKFLKNGK